MEIVIKIKPESPDAKISFTKEKQTQIKTVAIDELRQAFAETHQMSTGLLPKGTRFFEGSNNNFQILIEAVSKVRALSIDFSDWSGCTGVKTKRKGIEIIQVPCPICLFYVHVRNNMVNNAQAVSLKSSLTSLNDTLYRFPYSNTSAGGRVCWNSIRFPEMKGPLDAQEVVRLFFDSTFNGHIIDGGTMNKITIGTKTIKDPLTLMLTLEKQTEFPVEALCPDNSARIENWIRKQNV